MPSKDQKKLLKEMMIISSSIYNICNYEVRQRFFNKQKIPYFFDLQKIVQQSDDYKTLGRSYALPKIQKYSETLNGFFKLIKSKTQKHVGLPKYLKNRKTKTTIPSILLMDGIQYKISEDNVRIPLSNVLRKKYGLKDFHIKYNGVLKHIGKQCRGEIHYIDKKFYLFQSVEMDDIDKLEVKNSIGIDLGIKRLLTAYNPKDQLMIHSKRFYKQWSHYNDLIGKEQQFLQTINRRSSSKLKRLYRNRKKYQKQLFDNIICKLFRYCKRNNIQRLIIGDVKGIRDKRRNKNTNRMINNYWSYDIMYNKINAKSEELGITTDYITEEYTSQTCPVCGHCDKSNANDRSFICGKCSYSGDRDMVGARNIYYKGMSNPIRGHRNEAVPLEVSV